ncbi:hypothetical protein ACUL41_17600 [Virgibacillus natechei]|uniref:hypothetical protein n=1 Tax=Virgibacillus sp. CBA3643 TaxID=2942278 RepID=UPI0035A2824B
MSYPILIKRRRASHITALLHAFINYSARADLQVSTLGKAVDARVRSSDGGTGNWARVSTTGTITLPNSVESGDVAHVQFSNDLTTIVNVRVAGEWKEYNN